MPINLCCDVCHAFIKRISTLDAKDMLRNPKSPICGHCESNRAKFHKNCEKALREIQRDADKIKAGIESKFMAVMKEAVEDSISQVAPSQEKEDAHRERSQIIRKESSGTGNESEAADSTSEKASETQTEEESSD